MPDGNGPISVTDLARRLQRVEDKLDERIATVDMLRASEKVFEAKEIGHAASVQALESRVNKIESALGSVNRAILVAFLTLVIQALVLLFALTGRTGR